MIIDVPVYIAIDVVGRPDHRRSPLAEHNFVIRFDTDDDYTPISWAKMYGGKPGTFYPDTGDVFSTAFDSNGYRKLVMRAKANPVDYCADATEGERLQEIADAARDASTNTVKD